MPKPSRPSKPGKPNGPPQGENPIQILKQIRERLRDIRDVEEDQLVALLDICGLLFERLPVPPGPATRFSISARTEPIGGGAAKKLTGSVEPLERSSPMAQATGNTGPVPVGSRVVVTLTSQDEDGNPAPMTGEMNAVNDQAQAPVITKISDTVHEIRVDPTDDRTAISTITGGDSDGDPSFIFTIDWDGQIVVKEATQFGLSVGFEPMA